MKTLSILILLLIVTTNGWAEYDIDKEHVRLLEEAEKCLIPMIRFTNVQKEEEPEECEEFTILHDREEICKISYNDEYVEIRVKRMKLDEEDVDFDDMYIDRTKNRI